MSREVAVVVRVETHAPSSSTVSGQIESPFGAHRFVGWLELMGHLEDVIDRARQAPDTNPGPQLPRR
jgi:hypothetical protein